MPLQPELDATTTRAALTALWSRTPLETLLSRPPAGGGYVAGTYLSTTSIVSILSVATESAGGIAAALTCGAAALWGSAGLFGTTIGATGIKGMLMSAGLISSTPVWVPVAVGGAIATGVGGTGYLLYHINRLKKKGEGLQPGQEAQFTERDAKLFEKILLAMHNRGRLPG